MALLRVDVWLPLSDVGPLRRCTETLLQQLLPEDWPSLLRHHLEHMPFPADSTLRYLRLSTAQLSDDFSEGRIFSSFTHAWVSLAHYPLAREPVVLRLACQYVIPA